MKKNRNTTLKLNLNTETVQQLTQKQLGQVAGGALPTNCCANRTQTCISCIDTVWC